MADIDLKAATPDTSINTSAFLFGADSQAAASPSVYAVSTVKAAIIGAGDVSVASGKTLTASNTLTLAGTDGTTMTFPSTSATLARTDAANSFTGDQTLASAAQLLWSTDLILTRKAAASLRLGAADAAAPVAQTLGVQSVVAGTTNTAGTDFVIAGSQGTGTGAGGSIVFRVAPAGSTGSAQNALTNVLEVMSTRTIRLYNSNDGTNSEFGYVRFNSNVFEIGTGTAGTGTARDLKIGANLSNGGNVTGGRVYFGSQFFMYEQFGYTYFSSSGNGYILDKVLRTSSIENTTFFEASEMTAPAAPSANKVRIYAEDDGAGKTRLMARFATGAAVQIAIEP